MESRREFRTRTRDGGVETTPGTVLEAKTDQRLPPTFPDLFAVVTRHLSTSLLSLHTALFPLFTPLAGILPCSVLRGQRCIASRASCHVGFNKHSLNE